MNCLLLPHSLHIRLFVEVILKFEKRLIRKRNFHNKISKKEFKRIGEIEEIHILKKVMRNEKDIAFPYRESNPGRLGESQES